MAPELDLGVMAEGIIELDPMSGRMVIRSVDENGENQFLDVQEHLSKYRGQEVRFIVTPFSTINELAKMVENGELSLDQVPNLRPS